MADLARERAQEMDPEPARPRLREREVEVRFRRRHRVELPPVVDDLDLDASFAHPERPLDLVPASVRVAVADHVRQDLLERERGRVGDRWRDAATLEEPARELAHSRPLCQVVPDRETDLLVHRPLAVERDPPGR